MKLKKNLSKHRLSPNQFYVLLSLKEPFDTSFINIHIELRILKAEGFIDSDYKLNAKGLSVLEDLQRSIVVKKDNPQLDKTIMSENIQKYIGIFPNIKLPNGKRARSTEKNLEPCFKWFFENYDYDWPTVLQATAVYVDEYEQKKYLYMRTSQYFIKKSTSDRSISSDLADYCELVRSGEDLENRDHFSEHVFKSKS